MLSTIRFLRQARSFNTAKRFISTVKPVYAESKSNAEKFDDTHLLKVFTHKQLSYSNTTADYPLMYETVSELIDIHAEKTPDKMLFAFPHQGKVHLTFKELKQRVNTVAQNLLELGYVKGDRICFLLPNTHELLVTFLAAVKIGLISVILNPAYQLYELEYMLNKTKAKGIVFYDSFKVLNHMALFQKLCPEMETWSTTDTSKRVDSAKFPFLKHLFVLNSPLVPDKKTYKGTIPFSYLTEPKSSGSKIQIPFVSPDDPSLILFTSGTTGQPKGAVMSQFGLINSASLSTQIVAKDFLKTFHTLANPIPMFHIFGLASGIILPIIFGNPIIFPFYFPETLSTLKAIEGYKCNSVRGTPTQYIDLINHPERKNMKLFLDTAILGGSTVTADLLKALNKELNIHRIIVGFGMTETSFCHSVTTELDKLKSYKYAYESIGRQLPYTETKITDPATGETVPLNTDGELNLRGYHVFKGYYEDPEKTAQTIDKDRWLKTGDICSMDENGYLFFKSRSKEIIKRGGANIYPAEVETFLRTHPNILDASVFGVPDKRLGEEVCAYVILKPNAAPLSLADIKQFCDGKISQFKVPRYLKIVDKFVINANNKILKSVMQNEAIKEFQL